VDILISLATITFSTMAVPYRVTYRHTELHTSYVNFSVLRKL